MKYQLSFFGERLCSDASSTAPRLIDPHRPIPQQGTVGVHAFSQLGLTDIRFIHAELTLARESPAMIPMNLGEAEDKSLADAHAAIEALFAGVSVPSL